MSVQDATKLSNCLWGDCVDLLSIGLPTGPTSGSGSATNDVMAGVIGDLFLSGIPPPPPIPSFLRNPVEYLSASNGSCDLCRWAAGEDVDELVQVTRKYPVVVNDVWYFVVVSAVIGAILFIILLFIAMLRCKEAKVKPLHDACSTSKVQVEKVHQPPLMNTTTPSIGTTSSTPKALWSALKNDGGYSLQHQPINPELMSCNYERIDYGSIGRTFGPPPARSLPPPPPLLPPPLPPCRPSTNQFIVRRPSHSRIKSSGLGAGTAILLPSSVDQHGNVHIMTESRDPMECHKVASDGTMSGGSGHVVQRVRESSPSMSLCSSSISSSSSSSSSSFQLPSPYLYEGIPKTSRRHFILPSTAGSKLHGYINHVSSSSSSSSSPLV